MEKGATYTLKNTVYLHLPLLLTGNCLMQRAALTGNEAAALFLATHGAKVNHVNKLVRTSV